MTRITIKIAAVLAVTLSLATYTAMADDAPADQTEQAKPAAQLPQGHPPLPAGHPPMQMPPNGMGQGKLPQGHPPIAEPKVYEKTDIEPDWHIAVRHLIVRPMGAQLHVTEVWAVVNPSDKAYIGKKEVVESAEASEEAPAEEATEVADLKAALAGVTPEQATTCSIHEEGRTTIAFKLPAIAQHIQPGQGFSTCCIKVENGTIYNAAALNPGTNNYRINYLLPAVEGQFVLPLDVPAMTGHMMVFLPDDGTEVVAEGLTAGDPFKAGDKSFRLYTGNNIEKGTELKLTIQVDQEQVEAAAAAMMPGGAGPADSAGMFKLVAGVGGGVLLIATIAMMIKPAKKQTPAEAAA